jgi:hypothetical protein
MSEQMACISYKELLLWTWKMDGMVNEMFQGTGCKNGYQFLGSIDPFIGALQKKIGRTQQCANTINPVLLSKVNSMTILTVEF